MSTRPVSASSTALPWVVIAGIVLVALSLRGPIVAPAPIIGEISADLGYSTTVAGLLTSLPVLFFALGTPFATRLIGRAGPGLAVVTSMLGVLLGTVVRSAGNGAVVLVGTVIIGASIAIGNIVVPVIIRRDVPWQRVGVATGMYAAALNVGSMATSLGTAPLAAAVGWRWALASWGVLALGAAVCWMWLGRRRGRADAAIEAPATDTASPAPSAAIRKIVWLLLLSFCGQSVAYYAVTAWLPTLLSDTAGLDPSASGATASLFQIAAVVGALGVPALASRTPVWAPAAVIGALWIVLPLGLLVAPESFTLWSIIGGVAQGGGFTVIFSIIARVSRGDREAGTMSARVQAGGYVVATFAPPLVGALSSATGGWTTPLMVVLAATLAYTVGAVTAALVARRHQQGR